GSDSSTQLPEIEFEAIPLEQYFALDIADVLEAIDPISYLEWKQLIAELAEAAAIAEVWVGEIIIAKTGGEAVGYAIYTFDDVLAMSNYMVVKDSKRRQKIGTRLLMHMYQLIQSQGIQGVISYIAFENYEHQALISSLERSGIIEYSRNYSSGSYWQYFVGIQDDQGQPQEMESESNYPGWLRRLKENIGKRDINNLKRYFRRSLRRLRISGSVDDVIAFVEKTDTGCVADISTVPHRVAVLRTLASRAPPYDRRKLGYSKEERDAFQLIIDDIVRHDVLGHLQNEMSHSDAMQVSIDYFIENPDEVVVFLSAIEQYDIELEPDYQEALLELVTSLGGQRLEGMLSSAEGTKRVLDSLQSGDRVLASGIIRASLGDILNAEDIQKIIEYFNQVRAAIDRLIAVVEEFEAFMPRLQFDRSDNIALSKSVREHRFPMLFIARIETAKEQLLELFEGNDINISTPLRLNQLMRHIIISPDGRLKERFDRLDEDYTQQRLQRSHLVGVFDCLHDLYCATAKIQSATLLVGLSPLPAPHLKNSPSQLKVASLSAAFDTLFSGRASGSAVFNLASQWTIGGIIALALQLFAATHKPLAERVFSATIIDAFRFSRGRLYELRAANGFYEGKLILEATQSVGVTSRHDQFRPLTDEKLHAFEEAQQNKPDQELIWFEHTRNRSRHYIDQGGWVDRDMVTQDAHEYGDGYRMRVQEILYVVIYDHHTNEPAYILLIDNWQNPCEGNQRRSKPLFETDADKEAKKRHVGMIVHLLCLALSRINLDATVEDVLSMRTNAEELSVLVHALPGRIQALRAPGKVEAAARGEARGRGSYSPALRALYTLIDQADVVCDDFLKHVRTWRGLVLSREEPGVAQEISEADFRDLGEQEIIVVSDFLTQMFRALNAEDMTEARIQTAEVLGNGLVAANKALSNLVGHIAGAVESQIQLREVIARNAVVLHEKYDAFDRLLSRIQTTFEGLGSIDLKMTEVAQEVYEAFCRQVDSLRGLASGELTEPVLVIEPVDACEVTSHLVATHALKTENRGTRAAPRFYFDIEDNLPLCLADREKLEDHLFEFFVNAKKYDATRIWVRIRHAGAWIVIDIRDDGMGIKPEDMEKVFVAYERGAAARAKKRVTGNGIGLSAARRDFRKMGGDVWISWTEPGEGTCFTIRLKAIEEDRRDVEEVFREDVVRLRDIHRLAKVAQEGGVSLERYVAFAAGYCSRQLESIREQIFHFCYNSAFADGSCQYMLGGMLGRTTTAQVAFSEAEDMLSLQEAFTVFTHLILGEEEFNFNRLPSKLYQVNNEYTTQQQTQQRLQDIFLRIHSIQTVYMLTFTMSSFGCDRLNIFLAADINKAISDSVGQLESELAAAERLEASVDQGARGYCATQPFKFNLSATAPVVFGFLSVWKFIVRDIVANSVKATWLQPNPEVVVTSRYDHNEIIVVIHDNGIGFDTRMLGWGVSGVESNGIGLQHIKMIIRNDYQGTLEIESTPEEGTTVTIRIPASFDQAYRTETPQACGFGIYRDGGTMDGFAECKTREVLNQAFDQSRVVQLNRLSAELRRRIDSVPELAQLLSIHGENIYFVLAESDIHNNSPPCIWYEAPDRFLTAATFGSSIYIPADLISYPNKAIKILTHELKHAGGEKEDVEEAETLAREALVRYAYRMYARGCLSSTEVQAYLGIDTIELESILENITQRYIGSQSEHDVISIGEGGYQTTAHIHKELGCIVKVRKHFVRVVYIHILYTLLTIVSRAGLVQKVKHLFFSTMCFVPFIFDVILRRQVSVQQSYAMAQDRLGGLAVPFIVDNGLIWQQSVLSVEKRLPLLYRNGRIDEAKALLSDVVELNCRMWRQGIFVKDLHHKNVGINENGVVQLMDVGACVDARLPDWQVRLYFGYSKATDLTFLSQLDKELCEYYRTLTDTFWTIENFDRLWNTESPRKVVYVVNEKLENRLLRYIDKAITRAVVLARIKRELLGRLNRIPLIPTSAEELTLAFQLFLRTLRDIAGSDYLYLVRREAVLMLQSCIQKLVALEEILLTESGSPCANRIIQGCRQCSIVADPQADPCDLCGDRVEFTKETIGSLRTFLAIARNILADLEEGIDNPRRLGRFLLYVFDYDDALAKGGCHVPQESLDMLQAILEDEGNIIIMSGRCMFDVGEASGLKTLLVDHLVRHMPQVIQANNRERLLFAAESGARIYRLDEQGDVQIDPEASTEFSVAQHEMIDIAIAQMCHKANISRKHIEITVSDAQVYIYFYPEARKRMLVAEGFLKEALADIDGSMHVTHVKIALHIALEEKSCMLQRLIQQRGISKEQYRKVIVAGDDRNDFSMLDLPQVMAIFTRRIFSALPIKGMFAGLRDKVIHAAGPKGLTQSVGTVLTVTALPKPATCKTCRVDRPELCGLALLPMDIFGGVVDGWLFALLVVGLVAWSLISRLRSYYVVGMFLAGFFATLFNTPESVESGVMLFCVAAAGRQSQKQKTESANLLMSKRRFLVEDGKEIKDMLEVLADETKPWDEVEQIRTTRIRHREELAPAPEGDHTQTDILKQARIGYEVLRYFITHQAQDMSNQELYQQLLNRVSTHEAARILGINYDRMRRILTSEDVKLRLRDAGLGEKYMPWRHGEVESASWKVHKAMLNLIISLEEDLVPTCRFAPFFHTSFGLGMKFFYQYTMNDLLKFLGKARRKAVFGDRSITVPSLLYTIDGEREDMIPLATLTQLVYELRRDRRIRKTKMWKPAIEVVCDVLNNPQLKATSVVNWVRKLNLVGKFTRYDPIRYIAPWSAAMAKEVCQREEGRKKHMKSLRALKIWTAPSWQITGNHWDIDCLLEVYVDPERSYYDREILKLQLKRRLRKQLLTGLTTRLRQELGTASRYGLPVSAVSLLEILAVVADDKALKRLELVSESIQEYRLAVGAIAYTVEVIRSRLGLGEAVPVHEISWFNKNKLICGSADIDSTARTQLAIRLEEQIFLDDPFWIRIERMARERKRASVAFDITRAIIIVYHHEGNYTLMIPVRSNLEEDRLFVDYIMSQNVFRYNPYPGDVCEAIDDLYAKRRDARKSLLRHMRVRNGSMILWAVQALLHNRATRQRVERFLSIKGNATDVRQAVSSYDLKADVWTMVAGRDVAQKAWATRRVMLYRTMVRDAKEDISAAAQQHLADDLWRLASGFEEVKDGIVYGSAYYLDRWSQWARYILNPDQTIGTIVTTDRRLVIRLPVLEKHLGQETVGKWTSGMPDVELANNDQVDAGEPEQDGEVVDPDELKIDALIAEAGVEQETYGSSGVDPDDPDFDVGDADEYAAEYPDEEDDQNSYCFLWPGFAGVDLTAGADSILFVVIAILAIGFTMKNTLGAARLKTAFSRSWKFIAAVIFLKIVETLILNDCTQDGSTALSFVIAATASEATDSDTHDDAGNGKRSLFSVQEYSYVIDEDGTERSAFGVLFDLKRPWAQVLSLMGQRQCRSTPVQDVSEGMYAQHEVEKEAHIDGTSLRVLEKEGFAAPCNPSAPARSQRWDHHTIRQIANRISAARSSGLLGMNEKKWRRLIRLRSFKAWLKKTAGLKPEYLPWIPLRKKGRDLARVTRRVHVEMLNALCREFRNIATVTQIKNYASRVFGISHTTVGQFISNISLLTGQARARAVFGNEKDSFNLISRAKKYTSQQWIGRVIEFPRLLLFVYELRRQNRILQEWEGIDKAAESIRGKTASNTANAQLVKKLGLVKVMVKMGVAPKRVAPWSRLIGQQIYAREKGGKSNETPLKALGILKTEKGARGRYAGYKWDTRRLLSVYTGLSHWDRMLLRGQLAWRRHGDLAAELIEKLKRVLRATPFESLSLKTVYTLEIVAATGTEDTIRRLGALKATYNQEEFVSAVDYTINKIQRRLGINGALAFHDIYWLNMVRNGGDAEAQQAQLQLALRLEEQNFERINGEQSKPQFPLLMRMEASAHNNNGNTRDSLEIDLNRSISILWNENGVYYLSIPIRLNLRAGQLIVEYNLTTDGFQIRGIQSHKGPDIDIVLPAPGRNASISAAGLDVRLTEQLRKVFGIIEAKSTPLRPIRKNIPGEGSIPIRYSIYPGLSFKEEALLFATLRSTEILRVRALTERTIRNCNMYLVKSLADLCFTEFVPAGSRSSQVYKDLFAAGIMGPNSDGRGGLVGAMRQFEFTGHPFASYAYVAIRNAMFMCIKTRLWPVTVWHIQEGVSYKAVRLDAWRNAENKRRSKQPRGNYLEDRFLLEITNNELLGRAEEIMQEDLASGERQVLSGNVFQQIFDTTELAGMMSCDRQNVILQRATGSEKLGVFLQAWDGFPMFYYRGNDAVVIKPGDMRALATLQDPQIIIALHRRWLEWFNDGKRTQLPVRLNQAFQLQPLGSCGEGHRMAYQRSLNQVFFHALTGETVDDYLQGLGEQEHATSRVVKHAPIVFVDLNPALEVVCDITEDFTAQLPRIVPGGSATTAACTLHQQGIPVRLFTLYPNHSAGQLYARLVDAALPNRVSSTNVIGDSRLTVTHRNAPRVCNEAPGFVKRWNLVEDQMVRRIARLPESRAIIAFGSGVLRNIPTYMHRRIIVETRDRNPDAIVMVDAEGACLKNMLSGLTSEHAEDAVLIDDYLESLLARIEQMDSGDNRETPLVADVVTTTLHGLAGLIDEREMREALLELEERVHGFGKMRFTSDERQFVLGLTRVFINNSGVRVAVIDMGNAGALITTRTKAYYVRVPVSLRAPFVAYGNAMFTYIVKAVHESLPGNKDVRRQPLGKIVREATAAAVLARNSRKVYLDAQAQREVRRRLKAIELKSTLPKNKTLRGLLNGWLRAAVVMVAFFAVLAFYPDIISLLNDSESVVSIIGFGQIFSNGEKNNDKVTLSPAQHVFLQRLARQGSPAGIARAFKTKGMTVSELTAQLRIIQHYLEDTVQDGSIVINYDEVSPRSILLTVEQAIGWSDLEVEQSDLDRLRRDVILTESNRSELESLVDEWIWAQPSLRATYLDHIWLEGSLMRSGQWIETVQIVNKNRGNHVMHVGLSSRLLHGEVFAVYDIQTNTFAIRSARQIIRSRMTPIGSFVNPIDRQPVGGLTKHEVLSLEEERILTAAWKEVAGVSSEFQDRICTTLVNCNGGILFDYIQKGFMTLPSHMKTVANFEELVRAVYAGISIDSDQTWSVTRSLKEFDPSRGRRISSFFAGMAGKVVTRFCEGEIVWLGDKPRSNHRIPEKAANAIADRCYRGAITRIEATRQILALGITHPDRILSNPQNSYQNNVSTDAQAESSNQPAADNDNFTWLDACDRDQLERDPEAALFGFFDNMDREDLTEILREFFNILSTREARILIGYYGLFAQPTQTLEAIGQDISLCRERVRQIKNQALARIREAFGKRAKQMLLEMREFVVCEDTLVSINLPEELRWLLSDDSFQVQFIETESDAWLSPSTHWCVAPLALFGMGEQTSMIVFIVVLAVVIAVFGRHIRRINIESIVKYFVYPSYRRQAHIRAGRAWLHKMLSSCEKRNLVKPFEIAQMREKTAQDPELLTPLLLYIPYNVIRVLKGGLPIIGTAISVGAVVGAIKLGQPWLLLGVFYDGILRFLATLFITGFKYPKALFLSSLPTGGILWPPISILATTYPELALLMLKFNNPAPWLRQWLRKTRHSVRYKYDASYRRRFESGLVRLRDELAAFDLSKAQVIAQRVTKGIRIAILIYVGLLILSIISCIIHFAPDVIGSLVQGSQDATVDAGVSTSAVLSAVALGQISNTAEPQSWSTHESLRILLRGMYAETRTLIQKRIQPILAADEKPWNPQELLALMIAVLSHPKPQALINNLARWSHLEGMRAHLIPQIQEPFTMRWGRGALVELLMLDELKRRGYEVLDVGLRFNGYVEVDALVRKDDKLFFVMTSACILTPQIALKSLRPLLDRLNRADVDDGLRHYVGLGLRDIEGIIFIGMCATTSQKTVSLALFKLQSRLAELDTKILFEPWRPDIRGYQVGCDLKGTWAAGEREVFEVARANIVTALKQNWNDYQWRTAKNLQRHREISYELARQFLGEAGWRLGNIQVGRSRRGHRSYLIYPFVLRRLFVQQRFPITIVLALFMAVGYAVWQAIMQDSSGANEIMQATMLVCGITVQINKAELKRRVSLRGTLLARYEITPAQLTEILGPEWNFLRLKKHLGLLHSVRNGDLIIGLDRDAEFVTLFLQRFEEVGMVLTRLGETFGFTGKSAPQFASGIAGYFSDRIDLERERERITAQPSYLLKIAQIDEDQLEKLVEKYEW
ncbi:ATP-binding protein, partial [Candidatus Omnitrophota bacterium]